MDNIKNISDLEGLSQVDEKNLLPPIEQPSYEQRSCAELFRMYKDGQLDIQPDFQRNLVWKPAAQTYFIDSLIKGLPIPSLIFALNSKTGQYVVIDGLQRISTIKRFYEDKKWKLTKLPDINQTISGQLVSVIKKKFPNFATRIDNTMIPVIIVKSDFAKDGNLNYLFDIFHRLNTGGQILNKQEIRNCIYTGKFNDLLKKIAKNDNWTSFIRKTSKINRFINEEFILRIFAFLDDLDGYTGNLAKYLDDYMAGKQNISDDEIKLKKDRLSSSLAIICKFCNPKSIKDLTKTQKEGLLVGVAHNIDKINSISKEDFITKYNTFTSDELFKKENLTQGLSKKDKVQERLNKSISIFGGK